VEVRRRAIAGLSCEMASLTALFSQLIPSSQEKPVSSFPTKPFVSLDSQFLPKIFVDAVDAIDSEPGLHKAVGES
jgi:hypothetical protein